MVAEHLLNVRTLGAFMGYIVTQNRFFRICDFAKRS